MFCHRSPEVQEYGMGWWTTPCALDSVITTVHLNSKTNIKKLKFGHPAGEPGQEGGRGGHDEGGGLEGGYPDIPGRRGEQGPLICLNFNKQELM